MVFFRANRNAKQNLEIDWSNKWEASVADAKATNRRNEDVDIMFYPGVARHYDKFVDFSTIIFSFLTFFSICFQSINTRILGTKFSR